MISMRNVSLAIVAMTFGYAQAIAIPEECILRTSQAYGVPNPVGTPFDQTSEIVAQLDTTSAITASRFCVDASFVELTAMRFTYTDDAAEEDTLSWLGPDETVNCFDSAFTETGIFATRIWYADDGIHAFEFGFSDGSANRVIGRTSNPTTSEAYTSQTQLNPSGEDTADGTPGQTSIAGFYGTETESKIETLGVLYFDPTCAQRVLTESTATTGGDSGTTTGEDTGTTTGGDSGTTTGGDSGTTTGGDSGTTTGGDSGTTTGGDSGTTTGEDSGTTTGGDSGTTAGGDSGTTTGSDSSTTTGGDSGTTTGGDSGTTTGEDSGTTTGGDSGTATGGDSGTTTGGDSGTTTTGGDSGTTTGGDSGTTTGGDSGTTTGGDSGTTTGGDSGTTTGGDSETTAGGDSGTTTGGDSGTTTGGSTTDGSTTGGSTTDGTATSGGSNTTSLTAPVQWDLTNEDDDDKLETWAIIVIAIAGVIVILLVSAVVVCYAKKSRVDASKVKIIVPQGHQGLRQESDMDMSKNPNVSTVPHIETDEENASQVNVRTNRAGTGIQDLSTKALQAEANQKIKM